VKPRGAKVEQISFAKISTGFAEAHRLKKAMQADDGEEAQSSLTAASVCQSAGLITGIGRFASNTVSLAGLPLNKQQARGGKRNEPSQWQLTG